jgi:nitrile hydratase beta subunit
MGGMHGFGEVRPQRDEPVFHDWWEGHAFALSVITQAAGLRETGIRATIEALPPADYLASSYYARWARALEAALVDAGTLTTADVDDRAATVEPGPTRSDATSPEFAAVLRRALDGPTETSGVALEGRFREGDRVTVRRMAPAAHHRCPRYVRGVTGTVARAGRGWPAAGEDRPEPVYTVRFALADLWGDDAEPGDLYIDLWERYLA